MNAIMNPEQDPPKNGSQDVPKLEATETERLRLQVLELEARLTELQQQSHETKSISERLELPAGANRNDLLEYIFKLQRRIFDLQDVVRGECSRCGLKKVNGCVDGAIEIAAGHGGRHVMCQNRKDENTFFEPTKVRIASPGPVNEGFLELMRGEPAPAPNETAPVADEAKDEKPK